MIVCIISMSKYVVAHCAMRLQRASLARRDVQLKISYAAGTAGTGSAVTDLIFSIAKREVTFFSVTALISFL
jgi:hypothetical protein